METRRGEHTPAKNTPLGLRRVDTAPGPVQDIYCAEYGELTKEGGGYGRYTQIYVNGSVVCIVTSRNWNDEVTVWSDYHSENWKDGKFQSIELHNVKDSYSSPEGQKK